MRCAPIGMALTVHKWSYPLEMCIVRYGANVPFLTKILSIRGLCGDGAHISSGHTGEYPDAGVNHISSGHVVWYGLHNRVRHISYVVDDHLKRVCRSVCAPYRQWLRARGNYMVVG